MSDWDDIKYFLAISKYGSVRGAANYLNVNHSTVSRRISQMEKRLGVLLFEKLPSGYEITPTGLEILALAENMEEQAATLERKVFGRDKGLSGKLRITLPTTMATHLIMPDIASFKQLHCAIKIELLSSYELVNLTKRQADVAIRLVYDQHDPPGHLFGHRLGHVYRGVYMSKILLAQMQEAPGRVWGNWVLKKEDGAIPSWAQEHDIEMHDNAYIVSDLHTQISATRHGMGLSILPCFVGDSDKELIRVPGSMICYYGELWLLTHGETRKAQKVRAFGDHIKTAMLKHKALLAGELAGG